MKLSVVIPTFDRPELLRRGLEALTRQTLERSAFEVVVVDDGSPQPVVALVDEFRDRLELQLIRKPNGGLAAARNAGAARASGEFLLFMDDDIRPSPDFLAAHLEAHSGRDRAVALGSLPHPDDLPRTPFLAYLERVIHYDLFLRYGTAANIPLPPLNGNSSLRRRHFEALGGYDLAFAGYGGEDTEMGYRLRRAGLEFVYAPKARGFHYHVKGFDAYQRDMHASGVTMVRIVRKHPEVRDRVKLDLVTGRLRGIRAGLRLRRIVFRALQAAPMVVVRLDRLIARLERHDLERVLYPLYLVVGHYHYGRGMREELDREPLE